MTTFWCADAQLPDKIAHGVRIQVADGRIESVTTAPCAGALMAAVATSGRGATRCMPWRRG